LAHRIYIDEQKAEGLLSELQNAHFAIVAKSSKPPLYQFDQSSPELMAMCGRLADCYSANIIEITNLIHSNLDKQAQRFADAFKWKKD
ncbi:MAG: hypothetical protein ABIS30_12865, partial [Gallionella sp.]